MSRPQVPEIFVGFKDRLWVLAILMETGMKSSRNWAQQKGRPQIPRPPSIFASSRTPICRSSMRARKAEARSFTSSRKSTRPSAVKKNRILLPSKLHSTRTSFISSLCWRIFFWHTSKASFSLARLRSSTRRSWSVAMRTMGRKGSTTCSSGTSWFPSAHWAYSSPCAVSTITCSPAVT